MVSDVLRFTAKQWPRACLCFGLLFAEVAALSDNPALGAQPNFAADNPETLTASIYDIASRPRRLLYWFRRVVTRSGSRTSVLREFLYPDGRPAARERVSYDGNALETLQVEELQTGAAGTAKIEPEAGNRSTAKLVFQYTKNAHVSPTIKREPFLKDTLIGDMVGPFLAFNWEPLLRGQSVSCRCVVIQRQETVGFTFKKESESKWNGRDVIILKMQPTSWVISALVSPLYFTVEKSPPHRVLQYVGRTTPKQLEGSRWKDLDAITVFDWPDLK